MNLYQRYFLYVTKSTVGIDTSFLNSLTAITQPDGNQLLHLFARVNDENDELHELYLLESIFAGHIINYHITDIVANQLIQWQLAEFCVTNMFI